MVEHIRSAVYFNPRSREGSDTYTRAEFISIHNFNPRSREGSDSRKSLILRLLLYFNPRSREGSDITLVMDLECGQLISIHAPARGATYWSGSCVKHGRFQSTLPRGERLHLLTFFRLQYGYILFHLTNKYSFCF